MDEGSVWKDIMQVIAFEMSVLMRKDYPELEMRWKRNSTAKTQNSKVSNIFIKQQTV